MIQFNTIFSDLDIDIALGVLLAEVKVKPSSEAFRTMMQEMASEMRKTLTLENYVGQRLEAGRKVYRALGKDPTRYRISSDSLLRRLIKAKDLYYVNNVVDINNILSLKTQWSLGAYDLSKVEGPIWYTIGSAEDVYKGIGRGILNIDKLPVLKDDKGAFGSATSDALRTMVTQDTTRLMMVIHGFGGDQGMVETLKDMATYLESEAHGQAITIEIYKSH